MIKLFRTLTPTHAPLALCIGNFDGVHRGHQAILRATVEAAREQRLTPAALSFEPLPREFFARVRPDAPAPARLMSATEKLAAFSANGIKAMWLPRFDADFSTQSPETFIAALVKMRARWLMVGEDFRFGAKRAGDIAQLIAAGKQHGFSVHAMPDIEISGERASSTKVREALANGNLSQAKVLLGRDYAITGRVIHGKKLGRTLGFPTANISLGPLARRRKPALTGVFAVRCRLVTRGLEGVAGKDGVILNGVANLGTNPVVSSENRHHLEVFLFDFAGDLYGQRLEVGFIEKIRDEQRFESLDSLVLQMHDDVAKAKHILRMKNDGSSHTQS